MPIDSTVVVIKSAVSPPIDGPRKGNTAKLAAIIRQPITVNRYVIRKGIDRQLVIYWYQSHGRAVASEYTSKVYMVLDAMRTNRTDAALVRVITPLPEDPAGQAAAEARAIEFVKGLAPALPDYLPS